MDKIRSFQSAFLGTPGSLEWPLGHFERKEEKVEVWP